MLLNFKVAGIPCRRAGGIQGFRAFMTYMSGNLVHDPRLQMGKGSDEQH